MHSPSELRPARWVLLKNPLDLTTNQIKRLDEVPWRASQLKEIDTKPRHFTHPSPTPATAHPAPSPLPYPTTAPYGPGQP
jgi:hypothetical protein